MRVQVGVQEGEEGKLVDRIPRVDHPRAVPAPAVGSTEADGGEDRVVQQPLLRDELPQAAQQLDGAPEHRQREMHGAERHQHRSHLHAGVEVAGQRRQPGRQQRDARAAGQGVANRVGRGQGQPEQGRHGQVIGHARGDTGQLDQRGHV